MEKAVRYARQRWGERGMISTNKAVFAVGARVVDFDKNSAPYFYIFGKGSSWDKAIADAENHLSAIEIRQLDD